MHRVSCRLTLSRLARSYLVTFQTSMLLSVAIQIVSPSDSRRVNGIEKSMRRKHSPLRPHHTRTDWSAPHDHTSLPIARMSTTAALWPTR
jgi:hypothetical protein